MSEPFFLTGAVAKIRVNNKTMAFCTNISYSVNITTLNPKILGMYESHTMEPVAYEVNGMFTIIRYAKGIKSLIPSPPPTVSDLGNGIGSWGDEALLSQLGAGDDGRPHEQVNPKLLDTSPMFDIEILQKASGTAMIPVRARFIRKPDQPVEPITKPSRTNELCIVAKIRDCRIQKMDFSMNKKGAVAETYSFRAAYLDEDSFNALASGVGHQY